MRMKLESRDLIRCSILGIVFLAVSSSSFFASQSADLSNLQSGLPEPGSDVFIVTGEYELNRFDAFSEYAVCITYADGTSVFDVLLKKEANDEYALYAYKNIESEQTKERMHLRHLEVGGARVGIDYQQALQLYQLAISVIQQATYKSTSVMTGNGAGCGLSINARDTGRISVMCDYDAEGKPASEIQKAAELLFRYVAEKDSSDLVKALARLKRAEVKSSL